MKQYVIFIIIYLLTVYLRYFLVICGIILRKVKKRRRTTEDAEQTEKLDWIRNYFKNELKAKWVKIKLEDSDRTFAAMSGFLAYPVLFISTGLLKKFSKKEFKYILSHEYAHYQKKHSIKQLIFIIAIVLVGLMSVWVDLTLGIRTNLYGWRFHIYPLLNALIFGFLTITYFRFHEFEADEFALENAGKESMISVTEKLKQENRLPGILNLASIPYKSRVRFANEQFNWNRLKRVKLLWTIILLFMCYFWVIPYMVMRREQAYIYFETDKVPDYKVAIVLGAGVKSDGTPSDILKDRLVTASELYEQGKAEKILVSGDNRWHHYNEPKVMKKYLVRELGVSESDVFEDFAGRRTYDTCIRAQEIWNINRAILVTQEFHLYRSLYVCEEFGIEVVGVTATRHLYAGEIYFKSREVLAIHKSVLDLYVKKPKYVSGDKEIDLSE